MAGKLEEKAIATLTIHGVPDMTPKGRRMIAEWLQHQANQIQDEGTKYSKRFTSKYLTLRKK